MALRTRTVCSVGLTLGLLLHTTTVLAAAAEQQNPEAPQKTQADYAVAQAKAPLTGSVKVGDLLDVSVYVAPTQQAEFTSHVRVAADGSIRLPILGSVTVAGVSVQDAEMAIAHKYTGRGVFTDCQVTIVTIEYGIEHSVSVSGEVQKPGIYPINGPMTLIDAIALAGGVTARAGMHAVVEHAGGPSTAVERQTTGGFDEVGNLSLSGGDKIQVDRAGVVYVVGEVNKPGGYTIDDSGTVSVLQAVALAGGTVSTAALNDSKLIRATPLGRTEIPIRLKDILRNKEQDQTMRGNDILFIPASGSKTVAIKSLNAIFQTVTGMAIYGRF